MSPIAKVVNDNGGKMYQRKDTEDRALPFRMWLREISTPMCMDLDMMFFKVVDDEELEPVAMMEITRTDTKETCDAYLAAILHRFFTRDWQGKMVRAVAKGLGIPAYIVLFNITVDKFWVYDIMGDGGWKKDVGELSMQRWINGLDKRGKIG